jgi:hypothetical protein
MSVLYCSLVSNKEKVKIVQSSSGRTFELQIKTIIPQMLKNSAIDRIEFDDNYLTYTRSKEITYLCISPKRLGEERPRKFIEILINKLVSRNFIEENGGDISDLLESEKKKGSLKELSLQSSLGSYIDNQINNFNSGAEDSLLAIKDIQKDVNLISKNIQGALIQQSKNINELNEKLLPTSEKIKTESIFLKKNVKKVEGETRFCCKPWVIKTTITIGTVILLLIIYTIVAYTRCGNFNAFC